MSQQQSSRGLATWKHILSAAAAELAATGELEVAAVSARAGVSSGLPYRYFGSRSGLLIAVIEDFYRRLGEAAALRTYEQPTWADRERQRIRDWVLALYNDPLAPLLLGGLVGDAEVAAANTRHLHVLIEVGARNIAHAQRCGEIPPDRDPELLAAMVLGGTHTVVGVALARQPRPEAETIIAEVWAAISGAVDHGRFQLG